MVALKPAKSSYGRRPRLEATADRRVGGGLRLVRPPRLEQLVAPVGDAEVRAAELVRGRDEDVTVERQHVDRFVRGVLHRVEPRQCADRVRELAHALHVDDRPERIRRRNGRDDAHALVELPLEVVEIESQIVGDVDPVELQALVGRELAPRRDAAVVVEPRDEDAVALLPVARRRPGEGEVEHGHVRAEDDVVGRAAEEAGCVGARACRRSPRRGVPVSYGAPRFAARVAQRLRDRQADLVGHLRAAGCIEEGEPAAQRREAAANCVDVEYGRTHGASLPGGNRSLASHPRLRQLRRDRLVTRVLRAGRLDRGRLCRHGRSVGGRHHDVRYRRRLRRRSQRVVHRRMAALAPARRDRPLHENLRPDVRGRRSRARAGPRQTAGGEQPRASRRRPRRPLHYACVGSRSPHRRDGRRSRRARRRGEDRHIRALER